ncbi:hypothetical protein CCHL11_02989 [Colletotrichum chlorophyti]|uniref:Uncharacterized protein n=1 Tax=Colletotrichum chlorophyti TaxID=708187 RepID=A0A1Q8RGD6_9PEZI|nr:hypothetical protein CCHL11_02989 [Colletotrichum chlorophyti]
MADPFNAYYQASHDLTAASSNDEYIPEGLVSARRTKFATQAHDLPGRRPSPQDMRERENTWFG